MKTCLMPLISASIAIAGCLLCGWPAAAQTVTDPASAPGDAAAATTAAEMPTDLTLVANLADNRPVGQLRPMTQWSAPNDIYLDDTGRAFVQSGGSQGRDIVFHRDGRPWTAAEMQAFGQAVDAATIRIQNNWAVINAQFSATLANNFAAWRHNQEINSTCHQDFINRVIRGEGYITISGQRYTVINDGRTYALLGNQLYVAPPGYNFNGNYNVLPIQTH